MKFALNCLIFTLLVFISQNVEAQDEAEVERISAECQKEHDVTDIDLSKIQNTPIEDIGKNFKCFVNCFLTKMEYLDENGKLDFDKVKDIAEMHGVENADLDDCKAMHDMVDDKCDYAFNIVSCVLSQEK
ncbi:general odorant-binding protein 57c-like [Cochliomyia hominivorax]